MMREDDDTSGEYLYNNVSQQCLSRICSYPAFYFPFQVDAAFDALTERHNMRSKIHKHHFNAVAQWKDTVKLASQATAIFNNIDYGKGNTSRTDPR